MLRSLSSQRRKLVYAAAALVAGAIVLTAFAATQPRPSLRSDGVVPVLVVHGYGGDAGTMEAVAARLRREGREVVPVDLPNMGTGDIGESAEAVADAVASTRAPVVDLVGFSAGGVVVRDYVDDENAARARTVVTLGSPHHGAAVAEMAASAELGACAGACAQLVPGSAFLADLNEPDETPAGPLFVSIWTARDGTVTPPESAVLEGAVNVRLQDVCTDATAGHGDLVRDPLSLGLVVAALDGTLTAPPGPDRCAELRAKGA